MFKVIKNKEMENPKRIVAGKLNRLVRVSDCAECPFMSELSELEFSSQQEGFAPIYFHKCNLDLDLDIDEYLENPELGKHPDCKLNKEIIIVSS